MFTSQYELKYGYIDIVNDFCVITRYHRKTNWCYPGMALQDHKKQGARRPLFSSKNQSLEQLEQPQY